MLPHFPFSSSPINEWPRSGGQSPVTSWPTHIGEEKGNPERLFIISYNPESWVSSFLLLFFWWCQDSGFNKKLWRSGMRSNRHRLISHKRYAGQKKEQETSDPGIIFFCEKLWACGCRFFYISLFLFIGHCRYKFLYSFISLWSGSWPIIKIIKK